MRCFYKLTEPIVCDKCNFETYSSVIANYNLNPPEIYWHFVDGKKICNECFKKGDKDE